MSFRLSSPTADDRKSRFTYKNLTQLKNEKVECSLRVIAHIDLDAFYAQCEMVRLGVAEDQPLAVQQWANLIAVNYPARPFGISRHITAVEARKLCPGIKLVHVATWRVGSDSTNWGYRDDREDFDIATEKVSLDYYRRQSKKIFAIFRESCPQLEKASIDESFMDLSAMVYERLLERYPVELGVVDGTPIAPYGDPSEKLRLPEVGDVGWSDSFLIDLDEGETEEEHLDWDDVAMAIGAEIVSEIRKKVKEKLGYTCSAGIAKNKALAKIASGHKKPAQQSVVRNRAIQQFLAPMDFTKIRNLGGKFGREIVSTFDTEKIADLLSIPLETMKSKFDDDSGTWLYHIIRGIDKSEINVRTNIKSMLSAKSFRPVITTREQGEDWLKIFVADIVSRINEETIDTESSDEDNPVSIRRPTSMTLHHRHKSSSKSRMTQIPRGKPISEELLFPIAANLLRQIEAEGQCWPCLNLSLSVGGFDDVGRGNNRGIGSWLVRGDEAKMVNQESIKRSHPEDSIMPSERRRRQGGVDKFFGTGGDSSTQFGDLSAQSLYETTSGLRLHGFDSIENEDMDAEPPEKKQKSDHEAFDKPDLAPVIASTRKRFFTPEIPSDNNKSAASRPKAAPEAPSADENSFPCHLCDNKLIPIDQLDEHSDWHFARELAEADKKEQATIQREQSPAKKPLSAVKTAPSTNLKEDSKPIKEKRGRGRPPKSETLSTAGGGPPKLEKGQKTLHFGK